jgi:hypothetical protein
VSSIQNFMRWDSSPSRVMDYRLDGRGLISSTGKKFSYFLHSVQIISGPIKPLVLCVPGMCSLGGKMTGDIKFPAHLSLLLR